MYDLERASTSPYFYESTELLLRGGEAYDAEEQVALLHQIGLWVAADDGPRVLVSFAEDFDTRLEQD